VKLLDLVLPPGLAVAFELLSAGHDEVPPVVRGEGSREDPLSLALSRGGGVVTRP